MSLYSTLWDTANFVETPPVVALCSSPGNPLSGRSGAVPLDGPVTTAPAGTRQVNGGLPDPVCMLGDRDSRVTQGNIASTICEAGWSKQVRPPASVTEPIKKERMRVYGVSTPAKSVELDHEIPIGIGAATSPANLWPQPWDGGAGTHKKR
ncbi:hypothetical protein [Mycobacterium simiae]|nr:hypothetical protein [Mycobacterium simiae]